MAAMLPRRSFHGRLVPVALALLLAAGCSVDATFTPLDDGGVDAPADDGNTDGDDTDAPPGTAVLTVTRDGTSTGTVSSNPGGINCGSTCSAAFAIDTMVTLTATPDTGASFAGWGGACSGMATTCTVTVSDATSVTATFHIAEYLVTVDLGGSGSGSVTAAAAGINCPGACTAMVQHGSQLSLTASTGAGSLFIGWTVAGGGSACAGTGVCTTTITGETTVTATFALNQSLEVTRTGTGSGTVTSNPTGINCGADCSETYPPATSVTLTATAAADSIFMGWSGGGCSGTGTCVVVVNGATLVTADFALRQYTLTVNKAGLGAGTVTSAPGGINCGAMCAATFNAGTSVTLTASPTAGSLFAGWSGGGCTGTSTCTVSLSAATTVTATFNPILHTLTVMRSGAGTGTVTSAPAGINCGADCTEDYAQGAMVTLTASASAGSTFTGWTGAGCTGTGTCVVMMNAATTVTAAFSAVTVPLTIAKTGTGAGTITSSPGGINCGADCTESYTVGTGVTLSAAADPGSTFTGWSGGGCSGTGTCAVTMNMATTVTATFSLNTYTLSVTKNGTGAGTVTSNPAGINCGADCSETINHGTMVTLTAAPAAGSTFTSWSGGGCSGTGTCVVTVTAATAVTATFTINQVTLTVARSGAGSGTVTSSPSGISCGADCMETVNYGTLMTLSASPAAGSTFNGWTGGGCSGTGTCAVTVTAATTVTADFVLAPFALSVTRAGTGTGTVTSNPAGINCGADCTEPYSNGTVVVLTAAAGANSTFTGWSGGGCTGTGSCTVIVNAAINVTATFTLDTYTLTAIRNGTGSGTVTSNPAGINCGADCNEVYGHGTSVTLTAAPAAGSTFTGWSGGGCSGTGTCTVTVTATTSVTATFTLNTYTLTAAKSGTGAGTVTSSPAGINCGTDCSEGYSHGTSVTLTAAASTGSTFTGWSGGGCTGTGTCVVSVTAATTVTAAFALNTYTLTAVKIGTGTVTSSPAGIDCGADCSEVVGHGTMWTLSAVAGAGYTFIGWSGGGCTGTGTCVVTVTAATTVTASFQLNTYTLTAARNGTGAGTVTSSPAGINCGTDCSEVYNHGTAITLSAAPAVGSTFTGWSGGGCSGTGTCVVTLTGATTVTATFAVNTYLLSVTKSGAGSGTVTSNPTGINCGADCSQSYDHGTSVVLTASPGSGSNFAGWSGGGCSGTGTCTVSMTAAATVNANFSVAQYTLSVSVIDAQGTNQARITSNIGGIDCRDLSGTCSAVFNAGQQVILTFTVGSGNLFEGWFGACLGQGTTCTLTINGDTSTTGRTSCNGPCV